VKEEDMATVWVELLGLSFAQTYYHAAGVCTRCLEAGQGEALILLHGTGGHAETYVRNLAAHAPYFRTLAIDMIGHGFTDKPNRPYTIPVYVQHVLDFMDAAGIEKAHFSGESLGGWVAAWLASEHPQRVGKLVLNTAGGLIADPQVMERIRTLSRAAVDNPAREAVRKRLEFLMYDPATVTDELVEIRYRVYTQPEMRQAMENILCLQEMETRKQNLFTPEQLRRITAPTLVVWTTHDPTAPPEVGRRFCEYIPNSRFHVMEHCGHWPQFESAEEFNRLHLEFLRS
jgi:2-hydroxy-6-oxonona-2,4-dienedioate hydrolase